MGSPTSAVSWKGIVQLRQCKMSRLLPTSFLVLFAAILLLLVISTSAEPARRGKQNGASTLTSTVEQQSSTSSTWCWSSLGCWPLPWWGGTTTTWYERDGVVRTMMCSAWHAVILGRTLVIFI